MKQASKNQVSELNKASENSDNAFAQAKAKRFDMLFYGKIMGLGTGLSFQDI
jgi:hypothetical protein